MADRLGDTLQKVGRLLLEPKMGFTAAMGAFRRLLLEWRNCCRLGTLGDTNLLNLSCVAGDWWSKNLATVTCKAIQLMTRRNERDTHVVCCVADSYIHLYSPEATA